MLATWGSAIVFSMCTLGCAPDRTTAPELAAPDPAQSAPVVEPVAEDADGSPEVFYPIDDPFPPPPPVPDKAGDPRAPLDASCAVDSDCEVKDVGNCCGRMPACVNRAARPHDAAAIQRECERTGTSSICGFQELSGCRCEANHCVGVPSVGDGAGDVR